MIILYLCLQCYQVSGPLVLTSDTYSCFYSMHNPGYLSFNTNAELILFVLVLAGVSTWSVCYNCHLCHAQNRKCFYGVWKGAKNWQIKSKKHVKNFALLFLFKKIVDCEKWGLVTSEVCRTLTWSGILLRYAPHTQLTLVLEIMTIDLLLCVIASIGRFVPVLFSVTLLLLSGPVLDIELKTLPPTSFGKLNLRCIILDAKEARSQKTTEENCTCFDKKNYQM